MDRLDRRQRPLLGSPWSARASAPSIYSRFSRPIPSIKHLSRDKRWQYLGLVNEPCFEKANGPRTKIGSACGWIRAAKIARPIRSKTNRNIPASKIGARGKNLPVGSYYGYASGIVGLRLFPNPDFDEAAQKKWDAEKFYTDPKYYNDQKIWFVPIVSACPAAFAMSGRARSNRRRTRKIPSGKTSTPIPGRNISGWTGFFSGKSDPSNFIYQLLHTSLPGTLDTSFISTDYINNPRTMNAVYNVGARLKIGRTLGRGKTGRRRTQEQAVPGLQANRGVGAVLSKRRTPYGRRAYLKDGADSVGILGALNRVFINIGLFSEEWLLHFNALVGGKKITPIRIEDAEKNSSYWNATVAQTPDVALFFLKTAQARLCSRMLPAASNI